MCTDFLVKTAVSNCGGNEGLGFVNGRSMEFALDLKSELFFRSEGHEFKGSKDFSWTGKYGYVGMNFMGLTGVCDGLNTQGLSTGSLWLPGSQYQYSDGTESLSDSDKKKAINVFDFCDWLLSNFTDCKEVKEALAEQEVIIGVPSEVAEEKLPLHFPVHDAMGESIVIEFIGGEVQVHDNPNGVLTNSPFFDWQIENLRNYVGVTPWGVSEEHQKQQGVQATGHGTGFMLLPGDSTPPSRFVRATMMTRYSNDVATLDEATTLAFHVLNTVDIPTGTSRDADAKPDEIFDYTQWVAVKDMTRKIFSVRFYNSPQVYSIDLNSINLKKLNGQVLSLSQNIYGIDLSDEAESMSKPIVENKVVLEALNA